MAKGIGRLHLHHWHCDGNTSCHHTGYCSDVRNDSHVQKSEGCGWSEGQIFIEEEFFEEIVFEEITKDRKQEGRESNKDLREINMFVVYRKKRNSEKIG